MNDLKDTLSEKESQYDKEFSRNREEKTSITQNAECTKALLDSTLKENERLKDELSKTQMDISTSNESEALWQTVKQLQSDILERDTTISSLKGVLSEAEGEASRVSNLEDEITSQSRNIESLRSDLEQSLASKTQMLSSIQLKDQELTSLTQKLADTDVILRNVNGLKDHIKEKNTTILTHEERIAEMQN